jgi:hypothetical protein
LSTSTIRVANSGEKMSLCRTWSGWSLRANGPPVKCTSATASGWAGNHPPTTTRQRTLRSLIQLAACLAVTAALTASAQDKKPEITGTWKSSSTNQNGQVRETTIKLKAEGDKLTGTVSGRNNDTAIEEGKIKGEEISFNVTREFNGNKMVTKYTGKVSGDTIKGKSETERDGQTRSRDWVAKREAAAKTPETK